MKNKICILGLGYVGLTLALKFCQKNFEVIGYDTNEKIITAEKINDMIKDKINNIGLLNDGEQQKSNIKIDGLIENYKDKTHIYKEFNITKKEVLNIEKEKEIQEIKTIFRETSYNDFIKINRLNIFLPHDLYRTLASYVDTHTLFDNEIQNIQNKIKIDGDSFGTQVKVLINVFEGYTVDELNDVFLNINQYVSGIKITDFLCSKLNSITCFVIKHTCIKDRIQLHIKNYYNEKINTPLNFIFSMFKR